MDKRRPVSPTRKTPDADRSLLGLLTRRDLAPLAIVIAASITAQTFFLNYTVDDAFITFRYSRNLIQGLGLVFNPGEHVEGFTNFLWTLYCAIPFATSLDVLWFSKLTLILLAAANLMLAVLLFRRVAPGAAWWLPFVPACLLALHTSFTVYAVNGIETQLFCFMLLLALCLASREFTKGGWTSAIFFGLLFLTRPDGALFFGLTWLTRLLFGKKDRSFWLWTAVFALMAGGLTVFRLAYFGQPVPNTYYAKSAGTLSDRVSLWGIRYFRDILRVVPNWLYIALPLTSLVVWRRLSVFARFIVIVPYVYLAYVLYIGGDVNFPHFRFLLHVLPLMAVSSFFTLLPKDRKSAGKGSTLARAGLLTASVACIALQVGQSVSVWKSMNATPESPRFRYLSLFPLAGGISIYPGIAERLREECPPGSTVVMQDVGAIPFYSGVKTFDIIGLVNGPLAQYFHRMNYTDYHRGLVTSDLLQEVDAHVRDVIIDSVKAEYVLYHVDSGDPDNLRYSFHFHNLAFDPRFQKLYRPVAEFRYPGTGRWDHVLFRRVQAEN
jgi:arabinofuranosyltransferase